MKMKMRTCVMMMVFGVAFLLWVGGAGAIPQEINYQGKLTDPSGNPLTGSYSIAFTIYDADTGGNDLWTETRTVPVSKGIFNVILGEENPISMEVFNGDERWLGIKVGSDAEMTPRAKIVSVGNAFHANTADSIGGQSLSDFVLKSGDTMAGPLTVEAVISANGLSMGSAESSATLNRVHINAPTEPDNNAVVNVGGELNGSIAAIGQPANTYSAQIFGQARNDGTASSYIGVWGKSDRTRNASEMLGILGEAYGDNYFNLLPVAVAGIGGTPSKSIADIGLFVGYAANFSLVAENFNGAGGGGLRVASSSETASIFEANYGGDSAFGGSGLTRYFRIYRGDAGDRPQVKLENNTALILDNGSSIEMTNGNITTGGYVSAETYYGDGSHLTGIAGGPGGYITKAGDTMGQVTLESSSANRFRYNMPDGFTPGVNSVINVGGEYDGAVNGLYIGSYALLPAGSVSTQIFGQARNDSTASGGLVSPGGMYTGVIGLADAGRDANELIGVTGVAYGSGALGGLIAAGDPTTSSQYGLLIYGYMNGSGLQVNNIDSNGSIAEFQFNGSDVLKVDNIGTHFDGPAFFGDYESDGTRHYGTITTYLDDYENLNLGIWGYNAEINRGGYPCLLADGGGWEMDCGPADGFNVYTCSYGDGESVTKVFEAPPSGSSAFLSGCAWDASDAVGIIFDNYAGGDHMLWADGAKLISIRNGGYEVAYVDKDGVYHSAGGSVEGGTYISKTGDTMGQVDSGTALNRFRFNMPDGYTAGHHSVLSLGGEFDGSIPENENTPPDSWSSQLFCQTRDDGTATAAYAGIWGKSALDAGNGAGVVAEAYGPDWNSLGILPTTVMGFGGTPDVPIANLGYFEGYADAWGLQVNNRNTSGGGGLLVNSNYDTGSIADFQYQGYNIMVVNDYGTYFNWPAWFGDGNIAGYYDGGGGSAVNLGIYGRDSVYNNILATAGGGWTMNCESGDGLNVYTNTSDTSPLMLRVPAPDSPALLSGYVTDYSPDPVGVVLDNVNTLTPGSKLLSIRNAGSEEAYVANDGTYHCNGTAGGIYLNNSGNSYITSDSEYPWYNVVIQSNGWDESGITGVAIRNATRLSENGTKIAVFQNYQGGEVPFADVATIYADGRVTVAGTIEASDSRIQMWNHTPESSSEAGNPGWTCYDDSYFYVWVANDHVKRVPLSDW